MTGREVVMRASLGALTILAALAGAPDALAFDSPQCDELRRAVDNPDLARRISSEPPGGDLECLMRIAAVRLSADEAVYAAQSAPLIQLALHVDDLHDLRELDTRRLVAGRLRSAADPFTTDAVYRRGITTPAHNDLFQQLNTRNFLDAATMLDAEPAPLDPAAGLAAAPDAGASIEVAALAPPAPGGCLSPSAVDDPDVARNAGALDGLCVTRASVSDGEVTFAFVSVADADDPDGPVWYLPHDDEDGAFDAAVHSVQRFGGRLVAIDGDEAREVGGLDPHRLFGRTEAEMRGCDGVRPYPAYTAFVLAAFAGAKEVLTIHNNADGGAVTARIRTSTLRGWRARRGSFRDTDNIVYVSGTASFNRSREARRTRDRLLGAGLNVVYEQVSARTNDCSLSNFVLLNDKRPYFSLDAETGSRVQDDMVDALLGVLGYKKRVS